MPLRLVIENASADYFDGRLYMDEPIARLRSLAAMRLQGDSFVPQAW